jgi:hypothetical protein
MFETLQDRLSGIFDKLQDQPARSVSEHGSADRRTIGQLVVTGDEGC